MLDNKMHKVFLALGSNLGDREGSLKKAIENISSDFLDDTEQSTIYETEPWGITDQPILGG